MSPSASAAPMSPTTSSARRPSTSTQIPVKPSVPQAVLLAGGSLISHEHDTSGTAELIQLADGHRVLALKELHTSDGPALHVWLTDAPVLAGSAGWHVFDDGRQLDLGDLKGNVGNQLYRIPDDADLQNYSSVSIWCERFSVSFGAAELTPR